MSEKFNEAGVETMSPHYGFMRDGQATAPQDYLPKIYAASPFRVLPVDMRPENKDKASSE